MEDIELPKGSEPLKNKQHEFFCHEYLIDLNITKAAIRAKFSEKSARQHGWVVFSRPEVQERIDFLKSQHIKELGIDAFYILKNLKSIAERCMQTEQILDKDGMPVFIRGGDDEYAAAYKFEHTGALKANELMMKHLGMLSDKVKHEHTGVDGGPIDLSIRVVFENDGEESTP
ncbi:terminase small subunit [Acinetobacter bereziniae]|uniref:terminase small subunit n=1 Tax=Acinetobacter bereziniae TaxID=106648 RepID=UPI00124FBECD|nr:terminase small subunit [Acinetobacter bereziniae]